MILLALKVKEPVRDYKDIDIQTEIE